MGISSTSSAAAASSFGTTYSYSTIISAFAAGFFVGFFMGFAYFRSLYVAYAMGQRSTARAGSPAGKLIEQRTVNLTPFVRIQIYTLQILKENANLFNLTTMHWLDRLHHITLNEMQCMVV
ncbi:unnamed protein product, partial [Sphagnum jensenii]